MRKPTPFAEQVDIIPNLNEQRIAAELREVSHPMHSPLIREVMQQLLHATTAWGRYGGMYETSERGDFPRLVIPPYIAKAYQRMSEAGGIRPDITPQFFDTKDTDMGTVDVPPDFSYLLWMRSTTMVDEVEDRSEWDYNPQFVLMKEAGQVKFGEWAASEMSMRNDEFGAGVNISWTWFETNKFRIKFANLAPKFKSQYFEDIASAIYTGVGSVFTNTLATYSKTASNKVITDINQAITALMRKENDNGKAVWKNASFTVLSPPEFQDKLDAAVRLSGVNPTTASFIKRPQIIYTAELPASSPNVIYVVVTKEQQNEYATRVPLRAHGPVDDIETFGSVLTYRGAYGSNLNVNSAIKLTFDPTATTFSVAGPIEVYGDTSGT